MNMIDYDQTYRDFRWSDIEQYFGWQSDSSVNLADELLDKPIREGRILGQQIALRYVDAERSEDYSFAEMRNLSNRFANVLKSAGIKRGDRVFIFMPRQPELYISLLGILKVAAIAGLLFEAFMEEALEDRLSDSGATAIITTMELKSRIPFDRLPDLTKIFILGENTNTKPDEIDWRKTMMAASPNFRPVLVKREDPAFMLYTSGSTGQPKGIVHAHNALLAYYVTGKYVLDLGPKDNYWCTADPGWITGLVYGLFAPWSHGVATIIRGGRFDPTAWYRTLVDYQVSVWYSAPTAFRMLMAAGDGLPKRFDLSRLRHILSVGEALNPEVIRWGRRVFGLEIRDTWFMTETGAQMICNYPCLPVRLGSMGKPMPGIEAAIIDDDGQPLPPLTVGNLAIKSGWPAEMCAVWGNPHKYADYYQHRPWFTSGDSAYIDGDGYFFFQGRLDDIIKTAGERVGPFEVESKLLEHPAVAEAGVVGKPDPLRGEIIKAFIVLNRNFTWSDELAVELRDFVKLGLAAHAAPREFAVVSELPKTRSGKILRRQLRGLDPA